MQLREKQRALFSLVAVAIFLVSMVSVGNAVAIPNSIPDSSPNIISYSQPQPAQSGGDSGTWAWWEQETNTTSDEWTWESKNWLFGPSPSFEIYHENGSLLTAESFAEINEIISVVVTVPKDILQGNDIGRVGFNGWYMTADWNYSAGFDFNYENWEYTYESWNAWSYQWNSTDEGGPPLPSFVDIIPAQCSNTTDANNYYFTFAIRFTADTPLGLYQIDMNIEDSENNWIGSYNFGTGYDFQGIAVGIDPDSAWSFSYGGSYTLQKIDMDGDMLYSVSRGTDFKMRFNITGDQPQWVKLGFNMPGGIQIPVNRTGWHSELQTTTGGWVYDTNLGTYAWDAAVNVTARVEVYGTYQDIEWTEFGTYTEVNVTYLDSVWNEATQVWEQNLVDTTQWVEKQMFYVYNYSSTFEQYFGYTYWGYPYETIQPNTWNEEITVFEPIPADYPILYELNATASSASIIGNEYVVDFVGHFTQKMPKTDQNSYFWFLTEVMGPDWRYYPDTWGEHSRQTQQEFDIAQSIAIESPVTLAKILNADGTEPRGWMFQVDKGEQFKVEGRLQGGSDIAGDIDGVSFRMETYDGFWTEEESRWTSLEFIVEIDTQGDVNLKAFNRTEKQNYTYGLYMDYVLTNITGWFYQYNETTNVWDWVYGNHQEWEWTEVEGWYWQWWSYNQETGAWQKEWLPWRGLETVVPGTFATVTGFTNWTEGGDFYASFFVTPNTTVPDSNYWWDFAFMNRTWFEDYSLGWGEHEFASWEKEWVYSFEYLGDQVYVDVVPNQLTYQFVDGTLIGEYAKGVEAPYIVIDGEDLPVQVRENYDPWSGNTWTNLFFYDYYDPATGKEVYYYLLQNDTKIWVTYDEGIVIYNITTATSETFLTAMEYPYNYYDGLTSYTYWVDIDGFFHMGDDTIYGMPYVTKIVHDHLEMPAYPTEQWFIIYGSGGSTEIITEFWWESIDQLYYMTTEGGSLLTFRYNDVAEYHEVFIGGVWEISTWPEGYFIEDYLGSPAYLVTWDVQRFWYTEIDTVKHEMPYPGAEARWEHELANTEFDGGLVPTTSSLLWNGNGYPVYGTGPLWVTIGAETMEVTDVVIPYLNATGTEVWDPLQTGVSGYIGTYGNDLAFTKVNQTLFTDVPQYNFALDFEYIDLFNGTTWIVNQTYLFLVFEYDLDGAAFNSTQEWPEYQYLGNSTWYQYTAMNGTIYTFPEWERPPVLNTHLVKAFYNQTDGFFYYDFGGGHYQYNFEGMHRMAYWIQNATFTGDLYLFWENYEWSVQPIYSFPYKTAYVDAIANLDFVYKLRLRWGNAIVEGLQPIESTVYKNFHDFVIGVPQWGMWGMQNWAINEDNGALDLDGDLDTTDDQYFIQEEYSSIDSWTHEYSKMWVSVLWDPNTTQYGDDMNINSWMGLDTYTWSYEWNQTFYWYHADNFTQLTSAEMQAVKDQLISPEGDPMAGYWDLAWMANNVTWEDILQQAIENGWDWMTSNEQTWTWLSFGVGQNYGTSYEEFGVEHWLNVGMHYEYSGLMVWEDDNENDLMDVDLANPGSGELSHYLIPDSVDSVDFVTPGAAYGDISESGEINVGVEDEVTWGVTFYGVNGTVFPFTLYGYWGWYDGVQQGSDLRTFDERPTKITIDELSFLVNFQGYLNTTEGALNNYADIKVDNYVGNWDLPDMIGGRDNLENQSLALNYFADVSMSDFAFKANGSFATGEETVGADTFAFETAGAPFAEMIMGGVTYDWGKNTTAPYDVVSMTTPVGTFRQAYESESGQSAMGWSSSSTMFYVTIGFPQWEGYSVFQDPVFVSYTSSRGTSAPVGGVNFGTFSISPTVPSESDTVTVSVDIQSQMPIDEVYLDYTTDISSWSQQNNQMWNTGGDRYSGDIPAYADGTTVYFRVEVVSNGLVTQSQIGSYIVGQGMVTTTTGATYPTGPGGEGLPSEVLIMMAGIALVVVVVLVLVMKRRR